MESDAMLVKGEGLTRLEAERRLVKHYKSEYERLVRRRGHVDALRHLVRVHKNRYNTLVREAREVRRPWGPPEPNKNSTEAA